MKSRTTKNTKVTKRTVAIFAEIHAKLAAIENRLIWLINPQQRFRVGQRVEFSRRAHLCGIAGRARSWQGKIEKIDGFSVVVRLGGYKKASSYHHAFFNPVRGPKLF